MLLRITTGVMCVALLTGCNSSASSEPSESSHADEMGESSDDAASSGVISGAAEAGAVFERDASSETTQSAAQGSSAAPGAGGASGQSPTPDPAGSATSAGGNTGPDETAGAAGMAGSSNPVDPEQVRPGDPVVLPADAASPMEFCRYYWGTICARIRECDAPTFRPCESPADLCPDILFGADSTWTNEDVLSCAQTWTTHSCDELTFDRWPECSQKPGARALGSECAFDAQCESALCAGGVLPAYEPTCGQCATPIPLGGACAEDIPCTRGQLCDQGTCVDIEITPPVTPMDAGPAPSGGFVTPVAPECGEQMPCLPGQECQGGACMRVELDPLSQGEACSRFTECEAGLVCTIELFEDEADEPRQGLCQPRPPIGEACAPTFDRLGACAEGGTCTRRPTGECVPLREIGESCGWTECVPEAYCQTFSNVDDVESHFCYAKRTAGEPCFDIDFLCAEGLECQCPGADCVDSVCTRPQQLGETCDETTLLCAAELVCTAGLCAVPAPQVPSGPPPVLGEACVRYVTLGRITGDCGEEIEGIECLCADLACTASYCALPSLAGESCNGQTELCRQGYACENEVCVALDTLDLETRACMPVTP